MLVNPLYWVPYWRPIIVGIRILLTPLFAIVVWDYCKRLKDRESTGFWVNSEVNIRKAQKEVKLHDRDSSDSLADDSLALITTESAGSLHERMRKEDKRNRAKARKRRRAAKLRAAQQATKTRRQLEIEYVERTRKQEAHEARKELRRQIRERKEELDEEARLKAEANKLPPYDEDIRIRAAEESHNIPGDLKGHVSEIAIEIEPEPILPLK